jgi:hypothetical protein
LADAFKHFQAIEAEQGRLTAIVDDWESRSAVRQGLAEAQATLDHLQGEARDRRLQAALTPDAGIVLIGPDQIEAAEATVQRLRRELAELEETAAQMRTLAADPERRRRLIDAEGAKDAAIEAVVRSEAPAEIYLRGRRAAAVFQVLAEAKIPIGLPAPSSTDLVAAATQWLAWLAALRRGEVDAPAPMVP